MTVEEARALLIDNPVQALQRVGLFVDERSVPSAAFYGGEFLFDLEGVKAYAGKEDIFRVHIGSSGASVCHYFPAVPRTGEPGSGAGCCIVSAHAPAGTVVFSSGMNGCTLRIFLSNDTLIFVHDYNGKALGTEEGKNAFLPKLHQVNPHLSLDSQIGIVDASGYMGAGDVGYNELRVPNFENIVSQGYLYSYTPIAVKGADSKWRIFFSGVERMGTTPDRFVYRKIPGTCAAGVYQLFSCTV